ncbi:MAG: nucleotidyltransferase domain-containing protein [bacterium]
MNNIILDKKIKNKIINRIKDLNPEKIIIFGSYAYGNINENSDLDICVVEKNVKNKLEEKRKIRTRLHDFKIAKDILVPSKEKYEFYKDEINSVYNDIDKKGIVLWENS